MLLNVIPRFKGCKLQSSQENDFKNFDFKNFKRGAERKKEEKENLKGIVDLRINLRVFEAFQRDCA